MRKLASLVAGVVLATGLAAAPPAEAATPCASKAEYAKVKTNWTLTPAAVQYIFGVRGKRVAEFPVGNAWVTIYIYRGCGKSNAAIWYQGSPGHPAVAVAKQWVKR